MLFLDGTSAPTPTPTVTTPPPTSSCCFENGGTGCDDSSCESLVCGPRTGDEFCCETEWDDLCVEEALEVCPQLCFASDCCYEHGGLGCDEQACQDMISGAPTNDTFCCTDEWDIVCADEAKDVCSDTCEINI